MISFASDAGRQPAYLQIHRSGELRLRAREAVDRLAHCKMCPRACGANRLAGERGTCQTGRYACVSSHFPHRGEEACLSGWNGSGTIFFAQCNLRCVFCQNYDISQSSQFPEASPEKLAHIMLSLQTSGCHNINFVTPTHVVPQILEALVIAADAGLRLPLVYNTSAYDSVETLKLLDGVVDVYMPDFKIWDEEGAAKYLLARDYPDVARRALQEMHRQVGVLRMDECGLARRGLLVRHLVMSEGIAGTEQIATFLVEELSADTYVNLMAQYHPSGKVSRAAFSEINRRITPAEYSEAVWSAQKAGLRRLDR